MYCRTDRQTVLKFINMPIELVIAVIVMTDDESHIGICDPKIDLWVSYDTQRSDLLVFDVL